MSLRPSTGAELACSGDMNSGVPTISPAAVWVRVALGVEQLGQAEVEHLDEVLGAPALDEEDVLGLEVAVDDARVVGGVRARRRPARGSAPRSPRATGRGEEVVEGLALEVLHHEVVAVRRNHVHVEDVDDVLVADEVDRARFGVEARHQPLVGRQLVLQHLDGHPAADDRVFAEVDGPHAAPADHLGDLEGTQGRTHHAVGRLRRSSLLRATVDDWPGAGPGKRQRRGDQPARKPFTSRVLSTSPLRAQPRRAVATA